MEWRLTRRTVTAGLAGIAGSLAGCPSLGGDAASDDGTDAPTDAATPPSTDTRTPPPTDTGTPTETGTPPGSVVNVGAGGYRTTKPDQYEAPPSETYLAGDASPPVPTNSWWTSLAWEELGGTLWSHPFVTNPSFSGLEIGFPQEWAVTDEGPSGPNYAHLPRKTDLVVGPAADTQFRESVVTDWSDWTVSYRLRRGDAGFDVTQARGSPYLFFEFGDSTVELSLTSDPEVWAEDGATLGITVDGSHYGVYAPEGATWSGLDGEALTSDLGDGGYLTVAALPDATQETLATFGTYAHNHLTGTRIDWTYDSDAGEVRTTYTFETEAREGDAAGTLTALYPHQHKYTDADLSGHTYVSPRGPMETYAGESFEVVHTFPGVLPFLPDVGDYDDDEMASQVSSAASRSSFGAGPETPSDGAYWTGKNYIRMVETIPIAEQVGDDEAVTALTESMREELSGWLTPTEGTDLDTRDVFYYNEDWGTLQGYPAGFGAPAGLNDHHFHYGYFVRAAAELARQDPEWASDDAYGGMVDLVLRDYAEPTRDSDMFPFLRNFDPYGGHSWAAGNNGVFREGNNQESSSEAVNAYAAMVLWGEYTGNEQLRDAGVFLYTQEALAAREYWFDVDGENLPDLAEWDYDYACQVWGGGVAWTTWWTDRVEAIYLINVLPVGAYSLHLGLDDEAMGRTYDEMLERDTTSLFDYFPAIGAKFGALSDPADAADVWADMDQESVVGLGETVAHTTHWIETLGALGSPVPGVTADTALYSVLEADDGTRTYVAYNASDSETTVSFSDGTTLSVPPHSMGTTSA